MPRARTLFFTSPGQIEIREAALPPIKENEVLVESLCSAISAGTEMLVYRGQFPHLTDTHDPVSSDLSYPLSYGYASVGRVLETGKQVDESLQGCLVFGFQPHSSHYVCRFDSLITVPKPMTPEAACFLPNMETAVNLVQDGSPILGERVLVLGQGIVGLLTASLLSKFPLEELVTSDAYELRRKASVSLGQVRSFDSGSSNPDRSLFAYAQKKFDLTFELSGTPAALNDAIALTAFSGRIVIGSWYGQKRAEIDLGGMFHRSRISLISSQVSTISPELSGRWDKPRRFEVAWRALESIQPEKWITHRFSLKDAAKAYRLLDENPQETIQVIFEYGKN